MKTYCPKCSKEVDIEIVYKETLIYINEEQKLLKLKENRCKECGGLVILKKTRRL